MSHSHSGMDSMDGMEGMGGMDMGSTGLFQDTNLKIAHTLWYIVAATAIIRGSRTFVDYVRTVYAKRKQSLRSTIPSKPTNFFTQSYETVLTLFREMTYPAPRPFRSPFFRSFTPPSLGRSLLILAYWTIILTMLFSDVFLAPTSSLYGYRWEKPAFRAAWVSITQVPLLFALSCKFNVISIVTGISYERLNWIHRWVARTLFLTVVVHWAYFFHEWTLANFVQLEFRMMPMVKYGFGAWAVIGWSVITGFGFFRDLCYELWVLQHLASAGVLLWLLYVHVPVYARYNIWMAIGFVAFDRIVRGAWSLAINLHLRTFGKGGIGFQGEAKALSDGYLKLTIKHVDFNWKPGQHVFLSIPACGMFESHPFTIANTRNSLGPGQIIGGQGGSQDLEVLLKCHSGLTKRLQTRAQRPLGANRQLKTDRVFLSGPWGTPPLAAIERSNSLIFISSSTGASFTLPLLEHAIQKAPFVQRVSFYWIIRHPSQLTWFDHRLQAALRQLDLLQLEEVNIRIFITGIKPGTDPKRVDLPADTTAELRLCWLHSLGVPSETSHCGAADTDESITTASSSDDNIEVLEKTVSEKGIVTTTKETSSLNSSKASSRQCCGCKNCKCKPRIANPAFTFSLGRPQSFEPLIRPAVEAAQGETFIVACGGKDMMASVGTYVAALSDERAVHKGTGAQGIHLWTESYGCSQESVTAPSPKSIEKS